MLHEYRDIITHMKENSKEHAHFMHVFDKHNALDERITLIDNGKEHLSDMEVEQLKKEKLKLKDEAYAILHAYKQKHAL